MCRLIASLWIGWQRLMAMSANKRCKQQTIPAVTSVYSLLMRALSPDSLGWDITKSSMEIREKKAESDSRLTTLCVCEWSERSSRNLPWSFTSLHNKSCRRLQLRASCRGFSFLFLLVMVLLLRRGFMKVRASSGRIHPAATVISDSFSALWQANIYCPLSTSTQRTNINSHDTPPQTVSTR